MIDPSLSALGVVAQGFPQGATSVPSNPAANIARIDPKMTALGVVPTGMPGDQTNGASASNTDTSTQPHSSGGPIPTFFPASPNDGPIAAGFKTLGNMVPSTINFGIGALEMPFKLLGDAVQAPGAVTQDIQQKGIVGGLGEAFGNQLPSYLYQNLLPDIAKRGVEYAAGSLAGAIANNPNARAFITAAAGASPNSDNASPEQVRAVANTLKTNAAAGAAQNIEENPVGNIAPFLVVGREAAYAHSPEAGAAFDSTISDIGGPPGGAIGTVARAGLGWLTDKAGATMRYGVSQLTGLDPKTITTIAENPDKFSSSDIENTTRTGVAQVIKDAVDARQEQLSESGQAYAPLRGPDMGTIDVSSADLSDQIQKTTGMSFNEETGTWQRSTSGSILSPTDVAKVNQFYKTWQPVFDSEKMTTNEFLNMRSELAKIANYEGGFGKSDPLEGAASRMRGSFNTMYRSQIPGLEDLDAQFSSQSADLQRLSNGLFDREGNLRDVDINKIANATGVAKATLLSQLEELVPGITDKINALKAVEDIAKAEGNKVGTYYRAGLTSGGVLVGIATGNLPLVVGAITESILASPGVAVPILRAYGWSRGLVSAVKANLLSIADAANQSPNGGQAAFGALSPQLQNVANGLSGIISPTSQTTAQR